MPTEANIGESDVSVWERVIRFDDEPSPTAARALLKLQFSEIDRDRMHELAAKARAGTLTPDEERLIDTYVALGGSPRHPALEGSPCPEAPPRPRLMAVNAALVRLVHQRARGCCEYCQLPERFASISFEMDHIIAEQHDGPTVESNLALACFADNHHKGPNLAGIDPRTRKRAWLFNPRRQAWHRHFRWDGPVLVGRTPVGRATAAVLQMNAPHRVAQ